MVSDCLFCKIAAGEIPANLRYEDEHLIVFDDIDPQAPHHMLIVPREHISTTLDLNVNQDKLIGHIYRVAAQLAKELGFADHGFRIVNNCNEAGGQSVWHIHFHLLGGRQMVWPPG